tara:strand:- start:626 stop:877 length:252 start_codon:yes stop_codon:yes gene_type:complete
MLFANSAYSAVKFFVLVEAAGIEPAISLSISLTNQLVTVSRSGFLWVFGHHFISPSILSPKILRKKNNNFLWVKIENIKTQTL